MIVTRFAPSPTGYLHLGHAFSALSAAQAAHGGRFLLRIEDLDAGRCRPEYEAAILADLAWLGLAWEEPVRRQSEHLADYQAPLNRLIDAGLCYRCFRTRREALADLANAPHGPQAASVGAPLEPAEEKRRLAAGESFAWRLSMARVRDFLGPRAAGLSVEDESGRTPIDLAALDDVVIARKDFPASYHLASVWDDGLQGVTQIIRGEDLRACAPVHVVLQTLLGLPVPRYRHHRLILDEGGKRLAKRDQGKSLRALRQSGLKPGDVRALIGL